jgi:putative phosphoesterase
MKILVFSDSHGITREMSNVTEEEKPDLVLHLGDMVRDCDFCFYDTRVLRVRGNCDYGSNEETERFLDLGAVKIWMTHGHLYNVKSGLSEFIAKGESLGATILLFGHTHKPYLLKTADYTVMNPGAAHFSYGVIDVAEDGSADVRVEDVPADFRKI